MRLRPCPRTLACLAIAAAALVLPTAAAHTVEADHGDFTIAYEETGFTCDDVSLVGRHFDVAEAHFTLWATREGTAPDERLDEGMFTAQPEEDGDGFSFVIGPYNLGETGKPDGFDFAITWDDGEAHELHVAFDGRCAGDAPVPPCEDDIVTATANDDGTITLRWTQVGQTVEIYRDGVLHATVGTTEDPASRQYNDVGTVAGETYAYELRFLFGTSHVGRGCLEVTAVPFFGAPLFGALALVGAVGVHVVLRRR